MDELNGWGWQYATDRQRNRVAQGVVDQAFDTMRPRLVAAVEQFLASPVSACAFYGFEIALLALLRETGRLVLQAAVQALEPEDITALPENVFFQCGGYRRRSDRTPRRAMATRFGNVTLWRTGYRSWQRGEETIFPLELLLGLVENVSPALLDWIGKTTAEAGMSQPQRCKKLSGEGFEYLQHSLLKILSSAEC
jgi:hypothetical protein